VCSSDLLDVQALCFIEDQGTANQRINDMQQKLDQLNEELPDAKQI
jgi:hypothetical protein